MSDDKKITIKNKVVLSEYIQNSIKIVKYEHDFELYLYKPLKLYFIHVTTDNYVQILCSGLSNIYEEYTYTTTPIPSIDKYLRKSEYDYWPVEHIREYELQDVDVPELLN